MRFSEQDLKDIQHPTSPHYSLSATYSISLFMENDHRVYAEVNKRRRVDGTITAQDVKRVYEMFKFPVDEWAQGAINYDVLADSFNMDAEPAPVNDAIRLALETVKIEGNVASLAYQLSTTDYPKVNKILEALGGKWSRKAGGHVFDDKDPEEQIANYLVTGKLEKPEKFGFFPTPASLARDLVRRMGLESGDTVLEPEAGIGNLALAAAEVVGTHNVRCYELQAKNCKKLRELGFDTAETDFLAVAPPEDPDQLYSALVMNPPFERQADIQHALHAFQFLAPGGKFGAIMSQAITFRSNAKTVRFRQFLEKMGATITPNDPDAFRESGTLARTVTVTFRKPMSVTAPVRVDRPAPALHQPRISKPAPELAQMAIPQRPQAPVQGSFAF